MKKLLFLLVVLFTAVAANGQYIRWSSIVAGNPVGGNHANQLDNPQGMYMDKAGNIYVADYNNNRVQKFPPGGDSLTNGVTVAGGNGSGNGATQLANPFGVFVDGSGNLYVADRNNNRVQKFPAGSTSATSGITVAGGNGAGTGATQLDNPLSVFLDSQGYLYVCDYNNARVQKFAPGSTSATSGVTVAGGNGKGPADNQLNNPVSIFIDVLDNLYVSDNLNTRIQEFPLGSTSATNGLTVAGGNGAGHAANQLNGAQAVFLDANRNIYVSDFGNQRVQRFAPGSSTSTRAVTVGTSDAAGGLSVDTSGNIFVVNQFGDFVQKFTNIKGFKAGFSDVDVDTINNLLAYPASLDSSLTVQLKGFHGRDSSGILVPKDSVVFASASATAANKFSVQLPGVAIKVADTMGIFDYFAVDVFQPSYLSNIIFQFGVDSAVSTSQDSLQLWFPKSLLNRIETVGAVADSIVYNTSMFNTNDFNDADWGVPAFTFTTFDQLFHFFAIEGSAYHILSNSWRLYLIEHVNKVLADNALSTHNNMAYGLAEQATATHEALVYQYDQFILNRLHSTVTGTVQDSILNNELLDKNMSSLVNYQLLETDAASNKFLAPAKDFLIKGLTNKTIDAPFVADSRQAYKTMMAHQYCSSITNVFDSIVNVPLQAHIVGVLQSASWLIVDYLAATDSVTKRLNNTLSDMQKSIVSSQTYRVNTGGTQSISNSLDSIAASTKGLAFYTSAQAATPLTIVSSFNTALTPFKNIPQINVVQGAGMVTGLQKMQTDYTSIVGKNVYNMGVGHPPVFTSSESQFQLSPDYVSSFLPQIRGQLAVNNKPALNGERPDWVTRSADFIDSAYYSISLVKNAMVTAAVTDSATRQHYSNLVGSYCAAISADAVLKAVVLGSLQDTATDMAAYTAIFDNAYSQLLVVYQNMGTLLDSFNTLVTATPSGSLLVTKNVGTNAIFIDSIQHHFVFDIANIANTDAQNVLMKVYKYDGNTRVLLDSLHLGTLTANTILTIDTSYAIFTDSLSVDIQILLTSASGNAVDKDILLFKDKGFIEGISKPVISHQPKLELYPNPATGEIIAGIDIPLNGTASLRITDLAGRILMVKPSVPCMAGYNKCRHDISSLAPGAYIMQVLIDNSNYGCRLFVKE